MNKKKFIWNSNEYQKLQKTVVIATFSEVWDCENGVILVVSILTSWSIVGLILVLVKPKNIKLIVAAFPQSTSLVDLDSG